VLHFLASHIWDAGFKWVNIHHVMYHQDPLKKKKGEKHVEGLLRFYWRSETQLLLAVIYFRIHVFYYTIFWSSWRSQIKSIVGILIKHINWCLTNFIITCFCQIDGRDTKTISDFQPFFRKFKWFCRKPKTGSKIISRS